MRTKVWWQCSHSHTGTIPSRVVNSDDQLGHWLVGVERTHAKLYPLCPGSLLRIAPKKALLNNDAVALQWAIDHKRVHLSYEERKDARLVLT